MTLKEERNPMKNSKQMMTKICNIFHKTCTIPQMQEKEYNTVVLILIMIRVEPSKIELHFNSKHKIK